METPPSSFILGSIRPGGIYFYEVFVAQYNVCIVKPFTFPHSLAFTELGELLLRSIHELGHRVSMGYNNIEPRATNIILGFHLMTPKQIQALPPNSVIINAEQLGNNPEVDKRAVEASDKFKLWDYSAKNVEFIKRLGLPDAPLLKIGYQKELDRLDRKVQKEIDILFYGCVNDRRRKILTELEDKGLKVKVLFGVYGKERDSWIEKSKLVLNHHFYDSQIFEIVRVFYLLTNGVNVVSEVNSGAGGTEISQMYLDCIHSSKYDDLVQSCVALSASDKIPPVHKKFLNYPQRVFTEEVLDLG